MDDLAESIQAEVMGDIDKLRAELATVGENIEALKVKKDGVETNWLNAKSNALRIEFKVAIKEILNEELTRSLADTNRQLSKSNDILKLATSNLKSPSYATIIIALLVGAIVGISSAIIVLALNS